jgi:hypothetical protein
MTQEEINKFNAERLTDWGIELAHAQATAYVLIAIRHKGDDVGLHVCVPEGIHERYLLATLEDAARTIRAGGHRRL